MTQIEAKTHFVCLLLRKLATFHNSIVCVVYSIGGEGLRRHRLTRILSR